MFRPIAETIPAGYTIRMRSPSPSSWKVSIATPRLTGGGAEKVVRVVAERLRKHGRLQRVYVGTSPTNAAFGDLPLHELPGSRAASAVRSLMPAVWRDPAEVFLLSLGYMNFAPLIRLLRPRARLVIRLGNSIGPEISQIEGLARFRYLASGRAACRAADLVIAQCAFMAEDAARHLRIPENKLTTIYNPVENRLLSEKFGGESPIREPYILTAATMKPQKDWETLLAAYARMGGDTRRKLVVAGVAPDDHAFTALLGKHRLGADDVIRLGFVDSVYDLIANADLCVLSSHYEGFSNFLLEAAILGKRILASDCPGGNAELLAHYPNHDTFQVGDTGRVAELLAGPRKDVLIENAREMLSAFHFERIFPKYLDALFPGAARHQRDGE